MSDLEICGFIESINSPDRFAQTHAVSKIYDITSSLNGENAKDFLTQLVNVDNQSPEVQSQVARALGSLLQQIGGEEHLSFLIDSLVKYLAIDDNDVRDKAEWSVVCLGKNVSHAKLLEIIKPAIEKMSTNEFYGLRASAASLLCQLSEKFTPEEGSSLSAILLNLAKDKSMLVRKALGTSLPSAASSKTIPCIDQILEMFSKDESCLVQALVPAAAAAYGDTKLSEKLCETVFNGKWQCKCAVLDSSDALNLPQQQLDSFFSVAVMSEEEPVRLSAVRRLPSISGVTSSQFLEQLSKDTVAIRRSLSAALADSIQRYPELKEAAEKILPSLVSDSSPDVQLAAVEAVARTGVSINAAVDNIASLAEAANWRVRRDAARIVGKVASAAGPDVFCSELLPRLSALLKDGACDVRAAAAGAAKEAGDAFGREWLLEKIAPLVKAMLEDGSCGIRQSGVRAVAVLGLGKEMEDVLMKMANDSVSNVRMTLARECPRDLTAVLDILKKDSDPDVALFASQ